MPHQPNSSPATSSNASRPPRGERGIGFKIGVAVAALVIALFIAEVGLRLLGYETRAVNVTQIGRDVIRDPAPGVRFLFPPGMDFEQQWPTDPRGYFDPPNHSISYRVNNAGFRGRDFDTRRNSRIRIAWLGDSFCWGTGVRNEDHFTTILEHKLHSADIFDGDIEVHNFGMPGYSTTEEVALFEHVVLRYKPDVCVIWYFLNDTAGPGAGTMAYMGGNDMLRKWRRWSLILDKLVYPFDVQRGEKRMVESYIANHRVDSESFKELMSVLSRFADVCESQQIIPVLAVHPVLMNLTTNDYPFRDAHREVIQAAEQLGIHSFDLLPYVTGHDERGLWVHEVDQHPNELAHRLVAEGFYPQLVNVLHAEQARIRESQAAKLDAE